MGCELCIGSKCKGEKHFGENCGRLRQLFCNERKKLELMMKLKRQLIESHAAAGRRS